MAIYDLKKAHEKDELFYWCNALGEINMPGDGGIREHEEDELPPKVKKLYEKYQAEVDGCNLYTVNFRGQPGMLVAVLFDTCWAEDKLRHDEKLKPVIQTMSEDQIKRAVHSVMDNPLMDAIWAAALSMVEEVDGFRSLLIGKDTDPDGHELCEFILASRCEQDLDRSIKEFGSDGIYEKVWRMMMSRHAETITDILVTTRSDMPF